MVVTIATTSEGTVRQLSYARLCPGPRDSWAQAKGHTGYQLQDPRQCPQWGLPTPRVHREPRGVRRRRGLLPHPLKGEAGSRQQEVGRLRAGKALVDTAQGTSLRSPLWLYLGSPGPLSPVLLTKEAGRAQSAWERALGAPASHPGKGTLTTRFQAQRQRCRLRTRALSWSIFK